MTRAERAHRIARKLQRAYPSAGIALRFANPYQLLCATILSAQCTDERVNEVTPQLFKRFADANALARARQTEVERIIRPTGFFRNKARSLIGFANKVVRDHGGRVPATMEDLVALPGVGRKTANVILGNAFDTPGIVVDTHVSRVSQRLELTSQRDATRIEHELMELFPRASWTRLSHAMIFHGRRVCAARKPRCSDCVLAGDCPYPRRRRPAVC